MVLLKRFTRLLLAKILTWHVVSSLQHIVTFDVASNARNNLVITAEKAVDDLNKLQNNTIFKAKWFDSHDKEVNLPTNGNLLLERNTTIVYYVSIPDNLHNMLPNVLSLPLIGVWHQECIQCSKHALAVKRFMSSMTLNTQEQIDVTKKIAKKLEWNVIGILYEEKKFSTAFNLAEQLRKDAFVVHIAALNFRNNGSVAPFSEKDVHKIYDAKQDGIVVIINEEQIGHFFNYMNSKSSKFEMMKTSFLLYDLTDLVGFTASQIHTIIALRAEIREDAKLQALKTLLNPSEFDGKDVSKYAIMYDAVTSSGKTILNMIAMNQWNSTDGDILERGKKNAARSTEFFKTLNTFTDTGMTGHIEFDGNSIRKKMPLKIMHLQRNSLKQIGTYNKDGQLTLQKLPKENFEQGNILKINRTLRVVTIVEPPFITKQTLANGTVIYSGLLIDVLNEMGKLANFTYNLYEVADGAYGHQTNGKWAGLIGDVLYKKADLAVAPITITSARESVVFFTKPLISIKVGVVHQKAKLVSLDLLQFMTPFTTTVWLLILTACVAIGILLFSVDYFSPFGWRQYGAKKNDEEGNELNLGNSLWFSIQSILLQGADNTPKSLSGRILVGFFWFYVLILTSSYTANLAAFFTSEKATGDDSSLEALLKSGYNFTTIQNYALEQFLKISDYKVYNRIHERILLKRNMANSSADALRKVRADPEMYYLEETPFIKITINQKPCDLQIAETTIPETNWGFPVSKESPYAKAISYAITSLLESGFVEERDAYYEAKLSECSSSLDANGGSQGITADGRIEPLQMLGVYAFLLGGIVISIFVMIVENWWKKKVEERAARARARFKQSISGFRMSKRKNFANVKTFSVKPREPNAQMSMIVTDLMKGRDE